MGDGAGDARLLLSIWWTAAQDDRHWSSRSASSSTKAGRAYSPNSCVSGSADFCRALVSRNWHCAFSDALPRRLNLARVHQTTYFSFLPEGTLLLDREQTVWPIC